MFYDGFILEPKALAMIVSGSYSKTDPFEAATLRVYLNPAVRAALLIDPLYPDFWDILGV